MHRAYHALPPLKTPSGQPTGAVYGFCSMLLKVIEEFEPDYLAIAFDVKGPTFRHEEFPDYKAHRPEMDEELESQIGLVWEAVEAMQVPIYQMEGYEADDVIGSITNQISDKPRVEALVVSGDLDLLQLVSNRVRVVSTQRGISDTVVYDIPAVREKFGVTPAQLDDYKALVGDSSDNIPGIKGVGPKTAEHLLSQYGDVVTVYNCLDRIEGKYRRKLVGRQEEALRWRSLVEIKRDVPIDFSLEDAVFEAERLAKARTLFRQLGFKSLLKRIASLVPVGSNQTSLSL